MTFEKVLEVFADYLKEDADYEVVLTSHGYAVMGWDDQRKNWNTSEHCATPEILCDHLLYSYGSFLELKLTDGERPLTEAEVRQIAAARQVMQEKCEN